MVYSLNPQTNSATQMLSSLL